MSPEEFVVKIGVSSKPYHRYADLATGLPFESVMVHAYVGGRKRAYRLEKKLHRQFSSRQTRGEWFKFKLSEKSLFHENFKAIYTQETGRILRWEKIFPENISRYLAIGVG